MKSKEVKKYVVTEDVLNLLLEQLDHSKPNTASLVRQYVDMNVQAFMEDTDGSKAED